jgi:diguanylate cyclase (GGDEF)-like protein/PAS domain S-box-containing protein
VDDFAGIRILIDFCIIGLFAFLRHQLFAGRVQLVAYVSVIAVFAFQTFAMASEGTTLVPTTALFSLLVIVAGFFFNLWGIVVAIMTSSLIVAGIILARHAGILPPPNLTESTLQWFIFTITFGVTGGLTYFSQHQTQEALTLAENEIRDRERAETELRKLSQAVEQSPVSIVIADVDGNIEYVNPRFIQLTGYSFDEAVGENPRILKTDLTPPETHQQLWETITQGKEWHGEFANCKKDGSLYYESANISPILNQNGITTHYLAVKEDITERKRIEQALAQTAAHLALAVRAGGVGTWEYDFINDCLTWDEQMYHLYGITPQDFSGAYEAWLKGLHPQDRARGHKEIQAALRGEQEFDTEFRVVWPDGNVHEIRALALVQRDQSGAPLSMIGTNWDITAQKLADKALSYAYWRLESTIEGTQAGTWEWNVQTGEMNLNKQWVHIMGYSLAEMASPRIQTVNLLTHPDDLVRSEELFARHFMGTLAYYDCELRVKHKDGHWVWVQDRGQVITWTADGKPMLIFGTRTDISVRKEADEKIRLLNIELENLALTDFLTNLPNRRYFMLQGAEELKRVTRNQEPLALIMLDIDLFKRVNDTYGHEVGDLALLHVAWVLKSSLREIDILARIGGEEFAVLLPNTGQNEACVLAERVRKLVQETPFKKTREAITITISSGVAVFEKGMSDIDDLLRNADVALYEAKHSGRNCVVIFQDNLPSRRGNN